MKWLEDARHHLQSGNNRQALEALRSVRAGYRLDPEGAQEVLEAASAVRASTSTDGSALDAMSSSTS